ncbi:glycosyltransferase [Sphingobacterium luzhongxinii]|uniref:glycosyltransferase n=1 Tax=Sphingobacterium luzhongxinii TaxID=2654181 RepID=UPI00196A14EE|nr:glycosyltransferase [Sphingobacterium sp. xlx-73]
MIKILQISSEVNSGSVGRVAEQIGEAVIEEGWDSHIAYARDKLPSKSNVIKIGSTFDLLVHGLYTRLTDRHGFASRKATKKLISKIKEIKPDLIQLQHMHGYFINIELLFNFLASANIPVVWTFHDCWSFTGHCAHYEFVNCQKWQDHCEHCPQIDEYPKSFVDNSYDNFERKKRLFNALPNLTIVPVSYWLGHETEKSFLNQNSIEVIQNGIDLDNFQIYDDKQLREKYQLQDKVVLLGVANPWNDRKGLNYFIELNKIISADYQIVLVGLSDNQIKDLPSNIIGINRTSDVKELAEFYSMSNVFVNPTLEDTFPTTNLEALACGTPVVTFRSGGSPESLTEETGRVVEKEDVEGLLQAIQELTEKPSSFYKEKCREKAVNFYNKKENFKKYIELYKKLLNKY